MCNCRGNKTADRTFDYVKTMAINFAIVEYNEAVARGEKDICIEIEIYWLDDGFCFRPKPQTTDGVKPVFTVVYRG
jgi:hypothetical protein